MRVSFSELTIDVQLNYNVLDTVILTRATTYISEIQHFSSGNVQGMKPRYHVSRLDCCRHVSLLCYYVGVPYVKGEFHRQVGSWKTYFSLG